MDDDTNLQEAILEHAKFLGLDTDEDADLLYLAKECLLAAPPGMF